MMERSKIEAIRQVNREAAALLKDQYLYAICKTFLEQTLRTEGLKLADELAHRADEPPFKCACDGCEYRLEILRFLAKDRRV